MEVLKESVSMEEAPKNTEETPSIEEVKVEAPVGPVEEPQPMRKERKKRKKGRKIPKGLILFCKGAKYNPNLFISGKGFPKYFKNPYIQYCEFMRPLVIEENKEMDPVEVTKAVAAKW